MFRMILVFSLVACLTYQAVAEDESHMYRVKANAAFGAGDHAKALELYKKAYEVEPSLELKTKIDEMEGELKGGEKKGGARALPEEDYNSLLRKAIDAYRAKEDEKALILFRRVHEIKPSKKVKKFIEYLEAQSEMEMVVGSEASKGGRSWVKWGMMGLILEAILFNLSFS